MEALGLYGVVRPLFDSDISGRSCLHPGIMKLRFVYKGKSLEVESDELLRKLHRASQDYVCTTGRVATHLVLGDIEWAQFSGYVAYKISLGNIRVDPGIAGQPHTFCGLQLLRSATESLVMAVEQHKQI